MRPGLLGGIPCQKHKCANFSCMNAAVTTLIRILSYAYEEKRKLVAHLNKHQLNTTPANYNNNIGVLLHHLCYMERFTQVVSLEGAFKPNELEIWKGARCREMVPGRVFDHEIDHYLSTAQKLRAHSIHQLSEKEDPWLQEHTKGKFQPEKTQFGIWSHLIEEEFGHTYQIRMILKHL